MSIRLTLNLNQLYALNIRAFCINISTTDFISDKNSKKNKQLCYILHNTDYNFRRKNE